MYFRTWSPQTPYRKCFVVVGFFFFLHSFAESFTHGVSALLFGEPKDFEETLKDYKSIDM